MLADIKEIFESIQGEGTEVGRKQIFVRFTGCNLNCKYCDTDHKQTPIVMTLTEEELFDKLKGLNSGSISFTGGEPLLHADFIKSFLLKYKHFLKKEVYLETNGTLKEELEKIIDFIDIVAMDIKIESATGELDRFDINESFLKVAPEKTFIKVVFSKNIEEYEILSISNMAKKYAVPLILQPISPLDNAPYLEIFEKFYSKYQNTRLIPQTHKFLNVI